MCSANPIGLAIVQVITPYIVNSAGDIERMVSCFPTLSPPLSHLMYSFFLCIHTHTHTHTHTRTDSQLWIYAIPAGVTFIITIIAFWYKEPAIAPAPSGDRDHVPSFWRGLLEVSKNSLSLFLSLS